MVSASGFILQYKTCPASLPNLGIVPGQGLGVSPLITSYVELHALKGLLIHASLQISTICKMCIHFTDELPEAEKALRTVQLISHRGI